MNSTIENADPPSKYASYFILLTIVIDSMGFGIIVPVMPALLKELLGVGIEDAAIWGGYLTFVYAAMSFLFGPAIGSLSDRFGRRPVLLVSLGSLAVDYLIIGFAGSIFVLFIGRILSGICGATMGTANAYLADVTKKEQRAQAFGMVGAAFGIGFILGPAIGGLLGAIDSRAPFFASAGLALVNMAYGWFVLPESLKLENRRPFQWTRANPLGAFKHFTALPSVSWFLVSFMFFNLGQIVYPATWHFHGDARYGWTSHQIGLSLTAYGIAAAIVQGGLMGFAMKRFGPYKTVIAAFVLNITAFCGFAFSYEAWMVYAWIPVSAMGAVVAPGLNSCMSNLVGENSQGELQGAIAGIHGMANMIMPLVMTRVFHLFLSDAVPFRFPGAVFVMSAILSSIALIPFWIGIRRAKFAV